MGIEAIYRKPNTSKAALGHKIYPYLLRGLAIERPNQVWATDMSMPLQIRSYLLKCSQMAVLCFGALDCPGRP
jgi:putative transposase